MGYYGRSGRRPMSWLLLPLLAVAAIVLILMGVSLYFRGLGPSPYSTVPYPGWWFGWPFFGFGWVFIPLFFILLFFGFRWFFWGGWGPGWYGRYCDPAMEALRERYARGEITNEQFHEMARSLHDEPGAGGRPSRSQG